jgi:hypothetical protein
MRPPLVALVAAILLAGCVRDEPGGYAEPWNRNGEPVSIDVVSTNDGSPHCGWQKARFLHVYAPVYTAPAGQPKSAQYVRDPDGVLGDESLRRGFRGGATLPADAAPTGYERDGTALWLAESDRASTAYLVTENPRRGEAWPRADPSKGCD